MSAEIDPRRCVYNITLYTAVSRRGQKEKTGRVGKGGGRVEKWANSGESRKKNKNPSRR